MELAHLVGKTSNPFIFQVDQRHIRQFAQAIGDTNPLYIDEKYAKTTVHGGIIAPPTFPVAISPDNGEQFDLGLDYRRMLHGEQQFIYTRAIRPGDVLHCQLKVTDVYEREGKNGMMEFLVLDTEIVDTVGNHVVTSRMNIIYRSLVVK
ncbi:MaoC family dehydratase N-terminal domain-containing protein [Solibacillus sp. FSL K6-1523]|uniref:MaoC family dehydratase N-terminal domain-containing protein n=1 Tax=Solibacillus sp. FSL K6-1523 TaxID=2921471 RepID=UPI0030F65E02